MATLALGIAFSALPDSLSAQVSLGTVVELAQRNSSPVKLAKADLDKAYAVLSQSRDVYIPNFVIGSSIGPPSIGFPVANPSIASATMQSLAFSFPQKQYIEAARTGVKAATLNLKDAKEQVALDASTAYIELDTVTRELTAAHDQSSYSDRLVAIEQQRSEAGVDSLSDFLQARLTAAQLKVRLLHLEARARTLTSQLVVLTGLPVASIAIDHVSIPEIPAVQASDPAATNASIEAAQAQARSKQLQARGDVLGTRILPTIGFGAQYNRDATSLNNYNLYYGRVNPETGEVAKIKADEFSAGFSIQIPIWDFGRRAKSRETAAEALRATVEAEQAQRQNDIEIANLTGNLRELDALAEVASLKQQIATENLKTVQAQLELGNGSGVEPGATPQASPKIEQLARIDERQKSIDALDAGFDLSKVRLSLLRALGHIQDWLNEIRPGANASGSVTPPK